MGPQSSSAPWSIQTIRNAGNSNFIIQTQRVSEVRFNFPACVAAPCTSWHRIR